MGMSITLLNVLAAQFIISYGLSSQHHLHSKKYYTPEYNIHGYRAGHKYQNRLKNYQLNNYYFSNAHRSKPIKHYPFVPINGGERLIPSENAERKVTFYENLKPNKINSSKPLPSVRKLNSVNFVTPILESFPKNKYEVTTKITKEYATTARTTSLIDKVVPIALDDKHVVEEDEEVGASVYAVKGRRRPEHLNPLVYRDSYGRVHKRPASDDVAEESREYGQEQLDGTVYGHDYSHESDHGYDYGHGVIHYPPHHYKKNTGRVITQVFRGPTRKYGRKRYAPWGYYVVQPADSHHQYQQHYL